MKRLFIALLSITMASGALANDCETQEKSGLFVDLTWKAPSGFTDKPDKLTPEKDLKEYEIYLKNIETKKDYTVFASNKSTSCRVQVEKGTYQVWMKAIGVDATTSEASNLITKAAI